MRKYKRKNRRKLIEADKWDPYRDKWGLTPKRHKFVEHFTNPDSDTFLNACKSVRLSFNTKSARNATVIANRLKKDERVRMAIEKVAKEDTDLEQIVDQGFKKRLADVDHRQWLTAFDYYCKIRGAFAPEKHINMNLTPEQRDQKYDEILAKIRQAQSLPAPEPTKELEDDKTT